MNYPVRVVLLLVCCFAFNANAQNVFSKGDKVVNLGIGLGSYLGGSGYTQSLLPISGSFELGIKDKLFDEKSSLGVGGYIGYTANKWSVPGLTEYGYDYSYLIIGARGLLHYQFVDKLDTYGALTLGYNVVSSKTIGTLPSGVSAASASTVYFGISAGARYYFTDNIAAFAEVGYGIAALQLGVSFKF